MRTHLLAIFAAVLVVVLVVGVSLGRDTIHDAERRAEAEALSLVEVAGRALAANVAIAQGQAASIATNPGLGALFDDPSLCNLEFTLELFTDGHLDVYGRDGRVLCSSAPTASKGASHAGAPWLEDAAGENGLVPSRQFIDDVTGEPAVAVAAPVRDDAGQLVGGVAVVLPTSGVGERLTETYGGPTRFQFAVTDDLAAGELLTASTVLARARDIDRAADVGDPMRDVGYLAASGKVSGTSWRAFAGIDRDRGLGPTRSILIREAAVGAVTLVVLLGALGLVYRRIARPLRQLTAAVGSSGPHVDEILDATRGPSEIVDLSSEFRRAREEQQVYEDQLVHQALHDPLSGLPNRALLAERLTLSLERASREASGVAVLFLDIDRFKLVNDSLGHSAGDQLLQVAAARLGDVLLPGDTLARFGGDEFVVVLEDCTSPDKALEVARALLAAVEAPAQLADSIVRMSASIGVALSAPESQHGDLVRDADNAMFLAKERGGGRAEMFDPEMRHRVTRRRTLEHELRVALERDELRLVYQPKMDLLMREIVGVEALLRWDHPALGSIPPTTFIPIAEETGLILPVGRFVLDEACRQLAAWNDDGIDITVAVNVSERQLADPGFPAQVATALAAFGLRPERLCVELTESILMSDAIRATETLQELHAMGVQVSIDDFGTGYSSLAYLHRFPVDELKIDRAFIKDLTGHPDQETLVTAMVAMGRALGLRVVAEGVETADQATVLQLLGCDQAQGYHFARPDEPERLRASLPRRLAMRR